MNKVIKLNEQDLKRLVKESVEELKYSTYKSAYDKMKDKGQKERAANFNMTFQDKYNDDDARFSLYRDNVTFGTPRHEVAFNRDGSLDADETDSRDNWSNTRHFDDATSVMGKEKMPRTDDRKLARKRAKQLDFFHDGNSPFDKNDFIRECVNKVVDNMLGR